MRSRSFACVRVRLHPRDVFSPHELSAGSIMEHVYRGSCLLWQLSRSLFDACYYRLTERTASGNTPLLTAVAHLIVSCVGCRVPYACLRFVCGACNTILTCRSGEMGRGWAFHGPPPSRHSLSSGECTHTPGPPARLFDNTRCPNVTPPLEDPGTFPEQFRNSTLNCPRPSFFICPPPSVFVCCVY